MILGDPEPDGPKRTKDVSNSIKFDHKVNVLMWTCHFTQKGVYSPSSIQPHSESLILEQAEYPKYVVRFPATHTPKSTLVCR